MLVCDLQSNILKLNDAKQLKDQWRNTGEPAGICRAQDSKVSGIKDNDDVMPQR